jgi:uncharacterized repeat protein (TIGR01451 family)
MRPFSVRLMPPLVCTVLTSLLICCSALAETRVLPRHIPPAAALAKPIGRLPESTRLNLAIGLPLRDPSGLTNFLAQLYDPSSPLYHQYITPQEFTARFGPTEQDYQKVLEYARAHGLQITRVHSNRMLVDVDASVAEIEKAFHTSLRLYPHPAESRTFYAPDVEPTLDASVPVLHVSGLNDYVRPHPASLHPSSPGSGSNPAPLGGSGTGGSYLGKDFRGAYARGVTLKGEGQMVGLLEFDGFYQSDITSYEIAAALPNVPIEAVLTDDADGGAGANNVEVALDIEMVISIAPNIAQVLVYEASAQFGLANDILNRMATDNLAKQLSASWTFGTDSTTTQILMQFAAQGQTYFNASGDEGAFPGAKHLPPEDPYITLVGGTSLNTTGPGGAWVSEAVWQSSSGSSGGGVSTNFAIPTWQQGLNMSTNKGSTTLRNCPDVAMVADGVWVYYTDPTTGATGGVFGGTSCSAPLWAGFMALVNQQAVSLGQSTVGFLNPVVYGIGTRAGYTTNFHDITVGNNTNSSSPTKFFAVPGYDLCTGWGSPNGQSLINTLAPRAKAPVVVSSGATLIAEGCLTNNGAIDPGETVTVNFALKNLGAFKTTNLVATLQADSGVILPSASQSYSALTSGGAAVARPFTFTANAPCGGTLTATLLLTDGQANLGTATYNFPIGKPVNVLTQGFDSVTAPALPSGWTSTAISNGIKWVTSSAAKDLGTLSAYATEPPSNGVTELTSPPIQITTPSAQLIFKNYYNLETDPTVTNGGLAFDGGLLEIQIGTNAFADILAAGGSFVSGGYNKTIYTINDDTNADNPFAGRQAWSGFSGGFISTVVNFPASAAGQTIYLKWRLGTDTGNFYGGGAWNNGPGWYIDSIAVNDGFICCNSSADLAASQTASPDPAFLGRDTTYTIGVTNLGPEPAYNVVLTDLLSTNVAFTSASPGCVYTNGSVTCALGTIPINGGTNLQITVNPSSVGSISNFISIASVTPDPNSTNNSAAILTSVSGNSPPVVTLQPVDVHVTAGGTAQFQSAAQGAPTLSYQWFFNGTNIIGATSNSLNLTNVQPQHAGGYSVVITNSFGSVTSVVAQLTVVLPPAIALIPANVSATNVAVTLNSVVGLTYTLEYKNSLSDGTWTAILPSLPGTGGVISLQDTNGSLLPSRFYRVRGN